jgi:hypothetical protein
MSSQVTQQQTGDPNVSPVAPAAVGTGTYSAELLQHLVHQAAYFNLHSTPDAQDFHIAIHGNGGKEILGLRVTESLRRFSIRTYAPTERQPFRATNTIGEIAGNFTHCWKFIPDDYSAQPGSQIPPTALDVSRSQRFVMVDGICRFGNGEDGFRGFGTGKTYPSKQYGRSQLLVTAIGTLFKGFGKFKGHDECTYVYCGKLDVERGFTGSLMIRAMDPQGTLRTTRALPALRPAPEFEPEPDITYLMLRGQAAPTDLVAPRLDQNGQFLGLKVEQGVKMITVDASYRDRRGPQGVTSLGPFVGKLSADIVFDPTAPGGTLRDPIPFTTADHLSFPDRTRKPVGGFLADLVDGRVFNLEIPKGSDQKAIRFGGTGAVCEGTGVFEGIEGLMTDNSVVMFTPHVSASVYVLRIHDPYGRYRFKVGLR